MLLNHMGIGASPCFPNYAHESELGNHDVIVGNIYWWNTLLFTHNMCIGCAVGVMVLNTWIFAFNFATMQRALWICKYIILIHFIWFHRRMLSTAFIHLFRFELHLKSYDLDNIHYMNREIISLTFEARVGSLCFLVY